MKTYCVKEKRETTCVPGTERIVIATNGREMITCICANCGITKTQFVRKPIGRGIDDDDDKDYTCGLDPKKKPYSMKKCLEMKQVRYWGKNKIDSRLLEKGLMSSDPNKKRMKLISDRIALNAALKKLKDEKLYTSRFETEKIADINEKAQELMKKKSAINKQLQKYEKPTPPKKREIKIPELPKYVETDDPSIDARFQALMREDERLRKLKPKNKTPAKRKKAENNPKSFI